MIPLDYVNAHLASSPDKTGRTWDRDVIAKNLDFDLISRLRSGYTLGIYSEPTAKPKFHRIHVRLSDAAQKKYPHATVNARAGYYTNGR